MPTDLREVLAHNAQAQAQNEGDVLVASVWLVLYLVFLAVALVDQTADQTIARAVEFAARY